MESDQFLENIESMKFDNRNIFIVIPAFNESKVIEDVLLPLVKERYSIVVVDDCSTDDTWQIIKRLPVFSVHHPINLGQGAALQTGMVFALSQGAEMIVHFDADGQHHYRDIKLLLNPILTRKADVVIGSRFIRKAYVKLIPKSKQIVLILARIVNGIITGVWLTDAHNGFRALNRKAAQSIVLKENGYAHASEILIQIKKNHLRLTEQPTAVRYTKYSMAKGQPIWNAFNILIDLLLRRIF